MYLRPPFARIGRFCRLAGMIGLAIIFCGLFAPVKLAAQIKTYHPEGGNTEKFTIVLLTPESLIEPNVLSVDDFAGWVKKVMRACDIEIAKVQPPPRLLVQVTLNKDVPPEFSISSLPALDPVFSDGLNKAFSELPDFRTLRSSFTFRIQQPLSGNNIKDPFDEAAKFSPRPVNPKQAELEAYFEAPIAMQYAALRAWARDEAISLLTIAKGAEPDFVGVRAVGEMLSTVRFDKPLDVEKMTFNNPLYWRAIMEMEMGNHLVVASSIMLYVANGEMDKARDLYRLVYPTAKRDSLASILYNEYRVKSKMLDDNVSWRINQGIGLHDNGEYDKAMEVYQEVLAAYPCSAWARYELFYSEATKVGLEKVIEDEGGDSLWDKAAPEIYAMCPLYNTQFLGKRGENMAAATDRLKLKELNEKQGDDSGAYYGQVAQIAMYLKQYGIAAHIYWLYMGIEGGLKESTEDEGELKTLLLEDVLVRYFYCLEELGCGELKKQFKGDFASSFKELDAKLEKHRKQ